MKEKAWSTQKECKVCLTITIIYGIVAAIAFVALIVNYIWG